jgi:hypothetical protein
MSELQNNVDKVEWERRFKARIVERCLAGGFTQEEAEDRAIEEYEAWCEYDTSKGPPDLQQNPESAADEALSYDTEDGA